jgi:hypothetical protein
LLRPQLIPPLDVQRRVVETLEDHLSRLDKALAEMTQARTQAELLKTRVIDEVLREVATELSPHQYVSMDDVVASPKDIVDGPFGSNLKSEHYRSKGARVIRLQNIGVGKFIPNDSFISDDHFERLSKHEVRAGDLLFASLVESVPRTCIVPELESRAIVKADCIRIRVQPDVNTSWVFLTRAPVRQPSGCRTMSTALAEVALGLARLGHSLSSCPTARGRKPL